MAAADNDAVFTRGPDGKLTPEGEAERWTMEFAAARQKLKAWHTQGEKIVDRYLDERDRTSQGESRLNLFSANVDTVMAMLYGKTPKVSVSRSNADSADDVARVAGEMLERILNQDIEKDGDTFAVALEHALEDRLLPGFGFATVRYELETEPELDEAGEPMVDEDEQPLEKRAREDVATDWHYWKSCLWSPCRTFDQMRWFAWCVPMTRAEAAKRFGEEIARGLPMNAKTGKKGEPDAVKSDPWARVEVWEVWSKDDLATYWYVEGFGKTLDRKDNDLGLEGFFPFPKPLVARPTTRSFIPRPDFVLAQDLYNEIDKLTTRINLLEDAVRVAGVYDKASPEVARLLTEAGFNRLYAADNWANLSEKGGLKGVVDWFPLEAVVKAISVLTEKRVEKIGLLQQVTGWSDLMRGQSQASETLGAQKLKSQYASVRLQRMQDEFARFATDLQKIKAEIICKHFASETIIDRSNVLNTPDAEFAQKAVELLQSDARCYRIEVKPESINLTDYAALKQERVEVVGALSQLFTAAQPIVATVGQPGAKLTVSIGKWVLAGTKGSSEIEGDFDRFVKELEAIAAQPKPPPPPDPKLEAAKVKGQVDMAKSKMDLQVAQTEHQMDMQKLGAEVQADRAKAQTEIAVAQAKPPPVAVPPGVR